MVKYRPFSSLHYSYYKLVVCIILAAFLSTGSLVYQQQHERKPFSIQPNILSMKKDEGLSSFCIKKSTGIQQRPRFHRVHILPKEPKPFWGVVNFTPVPLYEINTHDPVHEDHFISGSVHMKHIWDPYIWDIFLRVLSSQPPQPLWVIDVGANIGYFSLMAASMGHHVIAFEPMSHNVARLKSSILRNPGFVDLIMLYQNAVSYESNAQVLLKPTHSSNQGNGQIIWGSNTQEAEHSDNDDDVDWIDTIQLDDLKLNQTITLLKIDVEGFETAVLNGARNLICNHKVLFIVMELSEATRQNSDCSLQHMLEFMEDVGYEISDVTMDAPRLSSRHMPLDSFPPNLLFTLKRPHSCSIKLKV